MAIAMGVVIDICTRFTRTIYFPLSIHFNEMLSFFFLNRFMRGRCVGGYGCCEMGALAHVGSC